MTSNEEHHRVRESFDASLKRLNCEYIDLYLIHWPQTSVDGERISPSLQGGLSYVSSGRVYAPDEAPTIVDVCQEMEKLLDTGMYDSMGYSTTHILTALKVKYDRLASPTFPSKLSK